MYEVLILPDLSIELGNVLMVLHKDVNSLPHAFVFTFSWAIPLEEIELWTHHNAAKIHNRFRFKLALSAAFMGYRWWVRM